jgi:WD40 repeat protein
MRKILALSALAATLAFSQALGLAQTVEQSSLATGFNNPRGIAYDSNGNLFVTESGTAGALEIVGPFGPAKLGYTAGLSVVAEGEQQVLLNGFPSMDDGIGSIVGMSAVAIDDSNIWVLTGHEVTNVPTAATLMGLDRISLRPNFVVDLYAFEAANNPDGKEVLSNPNDLAIAPDGSIYIIDASGNSLLRYMPGGEVEVVKAWDNNPVPTGIAFGPDGSYYVSFLSGFPFAEGSATIELYSAEGELVTTFEGLTSLTSLLWASSGDLYAVQYAVFGEQGWAADSGKVLAVTPDGVFTVAEGLNFPYDITETPDGALAVSVNSNSFEPGSGEVILLTVN